MTDNMDRTAWSVPVQLTEVPETGLHVEFEAPDHVRTGVADLADLRAGQIFTHAEAEAAAASYTRADTASDLVGILKALLLERDIKEAS